MYVAVIIALSILPTAVLFFVALNQADRPATTPVLAMAWVFLFGYTFKGLYLAYAEMTGAFHRLWYLSDGIIHIGTIAVTIGVFAWLFGYSLANQPQPPHRTLRLWPGEPGQFARLVYRLVLALSIVLMIVFFVQMGFIEQLASLNFRTQKAFETDEGFHTSLGFLTIGGEFILIFALYHYLFAPRLNWAHPVFLALAFCFLCYMLSGRRNAVLIGIVLFLLTMGGRAVAQKYLSGAGKYAVAGAIVLILSFTSLTRLSSEGSNLEDMDLSSAIGTTLEQNFTGSYFLDPAKTAAIIEEIDRTDGYLYGISYVRFGVALIPKVIWPNKPDARNSYFVADEILDSRTGSGIPPNAVGELYMNFGWFGVVFGMILAGAFSAWIWQRFLSATDGRYARVPYATALVCICLFVLFDFSMGAIFYIRYAIAMAIASAYWASWAEPASRQRPSEMTAYGSVRA